MRRPRLFLVNDHPLVLAALGKLLSEQYDVVGTAVDGKSLIPQVERLAPDLVIVDVSMPGMNGIELIQRLRGSLPAAQFLILSVHADSVYLKEALKAGARGYVLKQSPPSELFTAIKAVLAGRTYITPLIQQGTRRHQQGPKLTLRQIEVLRLTAEGLRNKEIAHKLAVSLKTVEYHKMNIMERLNLHNAASLTRYALNRGIA